MLKDEEDLILRIPRNEDRRRAVLGLWHDKDVRTENFLRQIVINPTQNFSVRIAAIQVLGGRRSKDAVPCLMDVLNNCRDAYQARVNAALALGKIGDCTALHILERVCADKETGEYLKNACNEAIERIKAS